MQRFADGQLHGAAALSSRLPAMRYGDVTFELADDEGHVLTWPAVVALTAAPVRYPLLGICGCLEFLDATFRGAERIIELQPNRSFPRPAS